MTSYRNRLTDVECAVVRETPELGWDAQTTADAWARIGEPAPRRLPLDLPDDLPEAPPTARPVRLADDTVSLGVRLAVALALAALVVVALLLTVRS